MTLITILSIATFIAAWGGFIGLAVLERDHKRMENQIKTVVEQLTKGKCENIEKVVPKETENNLTKTLERLFADNVLVVKIKGSIYRLLVDGVEYVPKDSERDGYYKLNYNFLGCQCHEPLSEKDAVSLITTKVCESPSLANASVASYRVWEKLPEEKYQ